MQVTIGATENQQITPDLKEHKDLEVEVGDYLLSKGFRTDEATYHAKMEPETVKMLGKRYSPTALYIRGRADRLAIHQKYPVEFEWEAKTGSKAYLNASIEVLPLLHHMKNASLGVKVLYAYSNPFHGHECGFWNTDVPSILSLRFTERQDDALRDIITECASKYWDNIKIYEQDFCSGSGDAFVLVSMAELAKLPSWKFLVNETVQSFEHKASA